MSHDLAHEFWNKLGKSHVVLLGVAGHDPVPMAPLVREDENAIWFITAADHDTFRASLAGTASSIYLGDSAVSLFGTVTGTLIAVDEPSKLDELWSPMAAAWFDDGRNDPSVRLMKFMPDQAEIWSGDGMVKSLFETVKANLAEGKPDMGKYGVITFKDAA